MTDRELMQQALDALEYVIQSVGGNAPESFDVWFQKTQVPAEALRARLAQPEPEPVTMVISKTGDSSVTMSWWHEPALPVGTSLYTAPPQREWQGLTNEEIGSVIEASQITLKNYCSEDKQTEYARAIEAKLKEKNT